MLNRFAIGYLLHTKLRLSRALFIAVSRSTRAENPSS